MKTFEVILSVLSIVLCFLTARLAIMEHKAADYGSRNIVFILCILAIAMFAISFNGILNLI